MHPEEVFAEISRVYIFEKVVLHVRVKVKNKCVRHQIVCESESFRVRETERESFWRPLNW